MKFLKRNFIKICDKQDVPLSVTRNNQVNICLGDHYEQKYWFEAVRPKNPKVVSLEYLINAIPLRIKQIYNDEDFIKNVNKFVRERQFYVMYEYFSCVTEWYYFIIFVYILS
jgi:hypothetical protein